MSFMPTNTYAEIQPFETGSNINSYLLKYITKIAKYGIYPVGNKFGLNHITAKLYLYITTCHDMRDGRGVFTSRKFTHSINAAVNVDKEVYI